MLFKISSGSTSAVVHQILSKSDNIFTEIWWFNDFQNVGRSPSWVLKICIFCHIAFVGMPFCFVEQKFAEIRKSVDELKSDFQDGGRRHLKFLKISIFGHVTTAFAICTEFYQIRVTWHSACATPKLLFSVMYSQKAGLRYCRYLWNYITDRQEISGQYLDNENVSGDAILWRHNKSKMADGRHFKDR